MNCQNTSYCQFDIQVKFLFFSRMTGNGPASMWGLGRVMAQQRPCMLAIVELNLR
jgi:hypothetical protein